MLSKRVRVGQLVFNLLLAGVIVLALGSQRGSTVVSAEPQAAPAQAAVPGGPGYLMVPAIAFLPESSTAAYTVIWGELSVPQGSPNPIYDFYAPVYLPQGARLTGLTMYYRDTIADTKYLGVDLWRKPLPSSSSGEGVGLNAYSETSPAIGLSLYLSDTTPDPTRAVIDNSQYVYWLSSYIYAAPVYLQLQAVRIDYAFSAVLPAVLK